jgi:Spy/CpxP family protein refolding chaperone
MKVVPLPCGGVFVDFRRSSRIRCLILSFALLPALLAQPPGDRFDKTHLENGGPDKVGKPRALRGPWWEGKLAQDLNLTEAQQKLIRQTAKEFRGHILELRTAIDKAEAELTAAFNDDPVDQKKSNEAIDHLAAARNDLFRSTSQMELKMRSVLTAQQWQELQNRQRAPRPDWPNSRRRPGAGPTPPPPGANQQK